jgi:hypothetical protein
MTALYLGAHSLFFEGSLTESLMSLNRRVTYEIQVPKSNSSMCSEIPQYPDITMGETLTHYIQYWLGTLL